MIDTERSEKVVNQKYKYTLIVSQYYHSRHMFIVEHPANFMEKAIAFSKELMKLKRDPEYKDYRCYHDAMCDLTSRTMSDEIHYRYNINDAGDIYFIQANYTNKLAWEWSDYKMQSYRESRAYIKKAIQEKINERHNYENVKKLVEKYFTIT